MKIITCAGYYRTGSSAISDFFAEFNNGKSLMDYEFRFIQDPDGISDLEYNIVENPHRHNSSFAIKRFLRRTKFWNGSIFSQRYRKFFGGSYYELTKEYIDSLVSLKARTWWHCDQIEKGSIFYFVDRLYAKVVSLIYKDRNNTSMLKNEVGYYTSISEEHFLDNTKKYLSKLFNVLNDGNYEFMMLDQLVPPTNIERYIRYFPDEVYVIVVDRDPRDLYVLEKCKYRWGIIPYDNVYEFCQWYRITREQKPSSDSNNILHIHFEDLIYKYDDTISKLMSFTGLFDDNHCYKMRHFNPNVSVKNTNLYHGYPELSRDINVIETELREYCYNFEG